MKKSVLFLVTLLIFTAACTKKKMIKPTVSPASYIIEEDIPSKSAKQVSKRQIPDSVKQDMMAPQAIVQPAEPMSFRSVYFDFDKADLRVEAVNTLTSDLLRKNAIQQKKQLIVLGYCDPRGTDSYNYDLGLRRALIVRQYLIDLGYNGALIKVKSFGKSKAKGINEETWQEDRRAEILVQ